MFDEIFYSECINCGVEIKYNEIVCEDCKSLIKRVSFRCKRCGCPLSIETEICKNCLTAHHFDNLYIPFLYVGAIRTVLKKVKFRYNYKGYKLISELVKKNLLLKDRYDIITAVPSTFLRRFRRFIHPAEYIALILSDIYKIPYELVLKRKRHTNYQWRLRKKDRFENVKGAFSPKRELFDLKILLVDDIMTTGATLNECCKVLKDAGAKKVDCYVLSKGLL